MPDTCGVAEEIDRASYCELVGINKSTLSRWVGAQVIVPTPTGPRGAYRFTNADLQLGKRVAEVHESCPGCFSLAEAVAIARGDEDLDEALAKVQGPGSKGPGPTTWPAWMSRK